MSCWGLGSGDQSAQAKSVPRVTPSPLATRCNVARVMFFSPRSMADAHATRAASSYRCRHFHKSYARDDTNALNTLSVHEFDRAIDRATYEATGLVASSSSYRMRAQT